MIDSAGFLSMIPSTRLSDELISSVAGASTDPTGPAVALRLPASEAPA